MNISVKEARQIKTVTLTDCMVTLDEFIAVVKFGAKLEFSQQMIDAVNANHALLDKFLEEGRIIYGVTTGFGENVRYTISPKDATTLQENIVRTHSCAVGEPLDREQARAVMPQDAEPGPDPLRPQRGLCGLSGRGGPPGHGLYGRGQNIPGRQGRARPARAEGERPGAPGPVL